MAVTGTEIPVGLRRVILRPAFEVGVGGLDVSALEGVCHRAGYHDGPRQIADDRVVDVGVPVFLIGTDVYLGVQYYGVLVAILYGVRLPKSASVARDDERIVSGLAEKLLRIALVVEGELVGNGLDIGTAVVRPTLERCVIEEALYSAVAALVGIECPVDVLAEQDDKAALVVRILRRGEVAVIDVVAVVAELRGWGRQRC